MTSATAIICYLPPPLSLSLSLGPSPSSQDSCQQSHCANFFEQGRLAISIGYSQKQDFTNIIVIISAGHGLRVFNIIADFMGCSMDLMVAGQRPSIQNSIVVLFPDIFMNFSLLSYQNLNRYII